MTITNFLGDEMLEEIKYYTCIACITIDCYKNGKNKLSVGLFRRMQIQNEKNKNDQIHRSWTRIRLRFWYQIRVKVLVRIWHWITVTLLFIVILL